MKKNLFILFLFLAILLLFSGCKAVLRNDPNYDPEPTSAQASEAESESSYPAAEKTGVEEQGAESNPLRAFPRAEGFGADAVGGRGGKVIEVTSLADSGPGTLREAIDADGPRTIVFRVSGTIKLESGLVITNPYVTLAGQTAPGAGITIRNAPGSDFYTTLTIETHDVIIRYLTIRRGPGGGGDALGIYAEGQDKIYNLIIDHCSLSWGVDEVANSWYAPHHYTIQWTILSEGLDCSTHPEGCHSKGFMLGSYASDENKTTPGAYNLSFHHNLMAHNGERNPLVKTAGLAEVINNVIYNSFSTFSHVDMENQIVPVLANYVGNYFKSGPNTEEDYAIKAIHPTEIGAGIFIKDNLVEYRDGKTATGIEIVEPDTREYLVTQPYPHSSIAVSPPVAAYEQVLEEAGAASGLNCDGTFFWRRDSIDQRIISDVMNTTGEVIDDPAQVGGWLVLEPSQACQDSDHDGMPDEWEEMNELDPFDPSDGPLDKDRDGYTNLEEFLNGMVWAEKG